MPSPVLVQFSFRIRTDNTKAQGGTPVWAAAQNTNARVPSGIPFRIRFCIEDTADPYPAQTYNIYYSKNGGAYLQVPSSPGTSPVYGADATNGASADNSAITTALLTGASGNFTNGQYDYSGITSAQTLNHNTYTEFEFGLEFNTPYVTAGDTYAFRVYGGSSGALNTYTATPVFTINTIYRLNANPANFTFTSSGSSNKSIRQIKADPAGYTFSAQAASETVLLSIPYDPATFNFYPGNATLSAVYIFQCDPASFTFTAGGAGLTPHWNPPQLTLLPSDFPPPGLTTQTSVIPSYPYKQYEDDDDIQSFFASYNNIAQEYINTINSLNLPIYTGSVINGLLLDWVGQGIYGYPRPVLSEYTIAIVGPLDTWELNGGPILNSIEKLGTANFITTTDDIYKRCLTWHIYKGDGRYFNVKWLKRRVMRFLYGVNGSAPDIDQTYQISVTFGSNNTISIKFIDYITTVVLSAAFNNFELNAAELNQCEIEDAPLTPLPFRDVFKEAVDVGALALPFLHNWTVTT